MAKSDLEKEVKYLKEKVELLQKYIDLMEKFKELEKTNPLPPMYTPIYITCPGPCPQPQPIYYSTPCIPQPTLPYYVSVWQGSTSWGSSSSSEIKAD